MQKLKNQAASLKREIKRKRNKTKFCNVIKLKIYIINFFFNFYKMFKQIYSLDFFFSIIFNQNLDFS
jgi:hypothetical protein